MIENTGTKVIFSGSDVSKLVIPGVTFAGFVDKLEVTDAYIVENINVRHYYTGPRRVVDVVFWYPGGWTKLQKDFPPDITVQIKDHLDQIRKTHYVLYMYNNKGNVMDEVVAIHPSAISSQTAFSNVVRTITEERAYVGPVGWSTPDGPGSDVLVNMAAVISDGTYPFSILYPYTYTQLLEEYGMTKNDA